MPSQFDNTYHEVFRKPTFDTEIEKKRWQLEKEAEEVFEVRPAPLPTKEMEVEYINWLQEDFKSDPWVTYRFRKYTANPKRIPWKNTRRIKRQSQFTFMTNWTICSFIAWPFAAMLGRAMKTTKTGVPIVPINRWIHDFPNIEPGRIARITFRYYSIGASIILGWCAARYITDMNRKSQNAWYSRPDLKPFAAMVERPADLAHKTMVHDQYVNQRHAEGNASPLHRFFFTRSADFEVKENPYQKLHPEDVWDPRKGHYPSYTNTFGKHHQ